MRLTKLVYFALFLNATLQAQDRVELADITEAFRLAGVVSTLQSLSTHTDDMTAAAVAQLPREDRQQIEVLNKDVSLRFLQTLAGSLMGGDPDMIVSQLRTYFVKHNDASKLATFLALQRTSAFRTMHRMESYAETSVGKAERRNFDLSLTSEPPSAMRVGVLRRLDEAMNTTGLRARLIVEIVNAMSTGLGAPKSADLETKNAAFIARIRPLLAAHTLADNLFIYQNAEDADLTEYVAAAQSPAIAWFYRNLQSAIIAFTADRASRAGQNLRTRISQEFR